MPAQPLAQAPGHQPGRPRYALGSGVSGQRSTVNGQRSTALGARVGVPSSVIEARLTRVAGVQRAWCCGRGVRRRRRRTRCGAMHCEIKDKDTQSQYKIARYHPMRDRPMRARWSVRYRPMRAVCEVRCHPSHEIRYCPNRLLCGVRSHPTGAL
eukprot:3744824-Rhodomonas_salina.1